MKQGDLQQLRHNLESQFRSKFYQDPKFPYLHSLGIKDLFQGFENSETGLVGILHMWWANEENNIVYDNQFTIKPKGIWHSEWFDSPEEVVEKAEEAQTNKYNVFNLEKLGGAILKANIMIAQRIKKRQAEKEMFENFEEEMPPKGYILN